MDDALPGLCSEAVRAWFHRTFPNGPTPAQRLAWPVIAAGEHTLLVSPTGTGKTLAAFLAILDHLWMLRDEGMLEETTYALYVSPLKSLGYDIERNLQGPLEEIGLGVEAEREGRSGSDVEANGIRVGVRTGDTSSYQRRKLRERPPHLLITTPESLALMLAQEQWRDHWRNVRYLIVDEVHALAPNKRGADLMLSLERLVDLCTRDPARIGLSATCNPAEVVAEFLVGPTRTCRVLQAPPPSSDQGPILDIETVLKEDEGPYRPLAYMRTIKRLVELIAEHRTTVVFANTRALAEKITHDLRESLDDSEAVAAHHSALDAARRREVEARLKDGQLRAVVTSTSLELGVDIGTADLTVMIGLPGSVARCLQRVGRAGHRVGAVTRGLFLTGSAAELAGAAVTAQGAQARKVEPIRPVRAPLDVLCQHLLGMACVDECEFDEVLALLRRASPMTDLSDQDLRACLDYLAGQLASPPGAYEPEPGATPRWTSPRIWKHRGRFAVRNARVKRWLLSNIGTIHSEEAITVVTPDGLEVGQLESTYAERLQRGDRFVLDGRAMTVRRLDDLTLHAEPSGSDPDLPRWTSDRQSLSRELALDLARFREQASVMLVEGPSALRGWLGETYELEPEAVAKLEELFLAQQQISRIPEPGSLLVEEAPDPEGWSYTFHAPLARAACEALGRAVGARIGGRRGCDVQLAVADLGWQIRVAPEMRLEPEALPSLLAIEGLDEAVLEGLDRGDLLARRFRHIAGTGLMVLRRPEDGRTRVGGTLWVSQRLYPLVKAACPDHPLLRETRREVLEDLLDLDAARAWLETKPPHRLIRLDGLSPFAVTWIAAGRGEPLQFEPPEAALKRLQARLVAPSPE